MGASMPITPKRAACSATNRLGSAQTRSVSAITASANMKFGTVSAIAPRATLLREHAIDETVRIARERDHEVLHLAVAVEARVGRERMSGAHRDDEVFFVERLPEESNRDVVGRNDRDVQRARLEVGERGAPRALG